MAAFAKTRLVIFGAFSTTVAATAVVMVSAQCVDYSSDPAGCQPSIFRTPVEQLPRGRVNREGKPDPTASEEEVRAGASLLERQLHLFRNFDHLHWVPILPSVRDSATNGWKGGDLDGDGDSRSFAMGGDCIFVGHSTAPTEDHPMAILKIAAHPDKDPPVIVDHIPVPSGRTSLTDPNRRIPTRGGPDDKEARALLFSISPGQDRLILVDFVGSALATYRIDPSTCRVISRVSLEEFVAGAPHEFFLWHDPANAKRVLIFVAMWEPGVPDPANPGQTVPGLSVVAVTDENTGELLARPRLVAGFTLSDVGGPPLNERPDATGLFSDGRFIDYGDQKDRSGRPVEHNTAEDNRLHSMTVSDDGARVYIAGGVLGFFVLNSEGVARHRNSELTSGAAACNARSTRVSDNGAFDASKLTQVANDCVHMVVSDDPGLKAFLASNASAQAKAQRYVVLLTRSRFDIHPPENAVMTGIHSAVFVPNRPAQVRGNTDNRPAYVFLTDENQGCPHTYARIVSVESEATPMMLGAFAVPGQTIEDCAATSSTLPGASSMSHNPTVFKNLAFVGWYGNGLRVIDISRPQTPREVGYALAVPCCSARGYPIFKDGLIYWHDTRTGLHVGRYTGPRADELPGPGSGIYDGNSTQPHR